MREIRKVALIGGGVIGSGWAARLLINGINVAVFDPSPDVEGPMRRVIENALRAYRKMTLAPVAEKGELSFHTSIESAVEGVDFVQENGPERIEIKKKIFQQVCAVTNKDIMVASSSSGLLPSDMQDQVMYPERVLIGHPFNPVYLMPLVEIVGGDQTSEQVKLDAAEFYQGIGMHPLILKKEIDAFLADRLQEALWREALHLVNEGVATTDDIDQAICFGPGLRWSFMGSFLTYRVAGGEGGMRHFMEQFGPSLKWPWTRFDGPDLTDDLLDRIEKQSDAQAAGESINALEHLRDDCLVSVLQALRSNNYAAGAVLKNYEEKLYESSHDSVMGEQDDISQPLRLHQDTVRPEWVDYNQHMTESRYLQVFGDASDALFRYIGIDSDYHDQGFSYYTVETHLSHIKEIAVHAPIYVTTQVSSCDEKRLHLFHSMYDENEELLATAEHMALHVDTNASKACPVREDILQRLKIILAAQSTLEQPKQLGRAIQPAKP